ncbi:acyl carrier protein [Kutzneria sp. NPDC052558]|uniref:acyl carrier protein n=1 Tax=Kutzneria sp. NPDC052558 TaxID=3364121 RepID=UPI0037CA97B8
MSTNTEVQDKLLAFLRERTGQEWTVDRDLFAEGGLSSLFAMELVVQLESTFDIEVAGPDLQLANFRTVTAMSELVARLRLETDD